MFKAPKATRMYQWIQAASLHSCAIGHHLELKECFDGKVISELKEELMKLREAHAEEIRSLENNVKRVEDKCSANEKEWVA